MDRRPDMPLRPGISWQCAGRHLLRREDGALGALFLLAIATVGVAVLGTATAFFAPRDEAPAHDQTAKLLPADTQIYLSLNLRPGNDQLRKFGDIVDRLRQHPGFQPKIDDLFDDVHEETGIHPGEDLISWLGPEIGFGFIVVGSAVAATTGGTPLVSRSRVIVTIE
jgi:hypothetical protein